MNLRIGRFTYLSFALVLILSLIVRLTIGESFLYGSYIDRDLIRAFNIPDQFFNYGPELSIAGRTPGGFFYYYLKIFELVSFNSPLYIYYISNLFNFLGSLFLFHKTLQVLNIKNNVIYLSLFSSIGFMLDFSLTLWNPTFTLFFHFLITYLFISFFYSKKSSQHSIPIAFFLIGLTSQIHLSGLFHILIFLILLLVSSRRISFKTILLSLFFLLFAYLPLILTFSTMPISNFQEIITSKEEMPLAPFFLLVHLIDYSFGGLGFFENGMREYPRWILIKGLGKFLNVSVLNFFSRGILFISLFSIILTTFYKKDTFIRTIHRGLAIVLLVTFFLYYFILFYFGDYALNFRRLYPILPYLFLFMVFSILILMNHFNSRKSRGTLTLIIFLSLSLNLSNFLLRDLPKFSTYKDYNSLLETALNRLNFSKQTINNKIAIGFYDPGINKCQLLINDLIQDSGGIDYIFKSKVFSSTSIDYKKCVFVIHERDTINCSLADYNLHNLNLISKNRNLLFYSYDKKTCYSSLKNRYL